MTPTKTLRSVFSWRMLFKLLHCAVEYMGPDIQKQFLWEPAKIESVHSKKLKWMGILKHSGFNFEILVDISVLKGNEH